MTFLVLGLAFLIALGVVAAVAARRAAGSRHEVRILEERLGTRLQTEPALAGLDIRVRVHRDPVGALRIELVGEAPSPWHRYAAGRAIERTLAQARIPGEVVHAIRLVPRERVPRPRRSA